MTILRTREIDSGPERNIITALIVSDEFCKLVSPSIKPELFVLKFARPVVSWCIEYFKKYSEAPKEKIEDLFLIKQSEIDKDSSDIIEAFLKEISEQYDSSRFNYELFKDQAFQYFRKRYAEMMIEKTNGFLSLGALDEAEGCIKEFHSIIRPISNWISPLDESRVEFVLDEEETEFFKFEGKLGTICGDWKREELVGIMSPSKRGKSWWLLEIAVLSLLSKLKVVYINLEMSENKLLLRLYKRFTALSELEGIHIYPCFDCRKNQIGVCTIPQRENKIRLYLPTEEKPAFDVSSPYRSCTYCRERIPREFQPETWFDIKEKKKINIHSISKSLRSIKESFGNNFREKTYPAFEANLSTIKSDIETLEITEGFIPDVIVIDYADILVPSANKDVDREFYDTTWKELKNLAGKKHCLVVTATQSNRGSFEKRSVKATDISEDIRKLQHVDRMVMLSQTPKEKSFGIMRVSVVLRNEGFDENLQVQVLQDYKFGQVVLDSEYLPKKPLFDE